MVTEALKLQRQVMQVNNNLGVKCRRNRPVDSKFPNNLLLFCLIRSLPVLVSTPLLFYTIVLSVFVICTEEGTCIGAETSAFIIIKVFRLV